MESKTPSIIDLDAELAKLTMFRGRTPQSTMADRTGSAARLAPYRDGALLTSKFAGKGHWETHWHRFHSSEGVTLMTATPFPGEKIDVDVDDPRMVAGRTPA